MLMSLTKSHFLQKWLPLETNHCPNFLLQKLGKATIEKRLTSYIEESWQRCSDMEFAEDFADYCQIEAAKVSDYLYRSLTTPLGEVITSIRFIGGDLSKPAVFLMHKDFELNTLKDIQLTGKFLREEYAVFQPKRFRWYSSKDESDLIAENKGIEGDLCYVMGLLSDLQKEPKPTHFEKINLKLAADLDWYDLYFNSYQEMYRTNPFFEEMASVESKDTLQKMMDKNWLFEVFIEGKWAGIIGVWQSKEYFLDGFEVYEEYLLPEFRGKHFAPAVQRHLIQRLPSKNFNMLYGTIHFQNKPSIKTAKRVGRKQVGIYIFAGI